MKSIYEFKKGDIITRVEPSAPLGKGGFFGDEGFQDRSYIGERYILAGIANGCVYLKRTDEIEKKIFGDRLIDLPLDIFENGWNYWIDPQTLLEDIDETLYVSECPCHLSQFDQNGDVMQGPAQTSLTKYSANLSDDMRSIILGDKKKYS